VSEIDNIGRLSEAITKHQIRFEMLSQEQADKLKTDVRAFLAAVLMELKKKYNSDEPGDVSKRLTFLAQLLPTTSVANAIALKAYHKRKSEITKVALLDPDQKKLGVQMIKDMAKDDCYDEIALLEFTKDIRSDLTEEIGALRTQLSYYREELHLKVGKWQK
jgi:hypothetical protein